MVKDIFVYFDKREDWRNWLEDNFDKKDEVWFIFPKKKSGQLSITYNDAVEDALCFGWIDSTVNAKSGHTNKTNRRPLCISVKLPASFTLSKTSV